MRTLLTVLICSLLLVGCGRSHVADSSDASLRDTAHTTAEYLANKALMARTVSACSAENDAQYNERMTHAGCKAVRNAMKASHRQAE
jgi:uncharacterized protein YcfL